MIWNQTKVEIAFEIILKSEKEIFCKMLWEQKIDLIISKYILKMDGNWAKIGTFVQRLFGVNTYHFKIRLAIIMTEARNVRFFHPSYSSMFCRDERRVSDLIVMTLVCYDSHSHLEYDNLHCNIGKNKSLLCIAQDILWYLGNWKLNIHNLALIFLLLLLDDAYWIIHII